MTDLGLRSLLHAVQTGEMSIQEAMHQLKDWPFENLEFARLDHQRELRKGFPEVVFGTGKTPDQIVAIARRLAAPGNNVLITRVDAAVYEAVKAELPQAEYSKIARLILIRPYKLTKQGRILVLTAGTADLPVAEEAALVAETFGCDIDRLYDVGVAGLHRLLSERVRLYRAEVLIVVAGMDGALASVVGGLVNKPVIAVPTSIGYGASFNGLAALLSMLNTCAPGVGVVNIDNGFGAAALAASILQLNADRLTSPQSTKLDRSDGD